ncbi:MAG: hypothetical protein GXP54_09365, partial [Deltaproteobacteria bacterium]|nr:hypothetical protein [Deltaproteobacteria bacterium]
MNTWKIATLCAMTFLWACGGGGGTSGDDLSGGDVLGDAAVDKGYDPGFTDLFVPPECQTAADCKDKFTDVGQCEVVICNAQQRCAKIGAADNTPCDDGVDCTKNDVCNLGICTG